MSSTVLYQNDGFSFTGANTDVGPYPVLGGRYGISLNAAWGGGSVTLKTLMPDGSTFVTVLAPFTADGAAVIDLPAGSYKLTITTATAVQGFLVRIPYRGA